MIVLNLYNFRKKHCLGRLRVIWCVACWETSGLLGKLKVMARVSRGKHLIHIQGFEDHVKSIQFEIFWHIVKPISVNWSPPGGGTSTYNAVLTIDLKPLRPDPLNQTDTSKSETQTQPETGSYISMMARWLLPKLKLPNVPSLCSDSHNNVSCVEATPKVPLSRDHLFRPHFSVSIWNRCGHIFLLT